MYPSLLRTKLKSSKAIKKKFEKEQENQLKVEFWGKVKKSGITGSKFSPKGTDEIEKFLARIWNLGENMVPNPLKHKRKI